MDIFGRIGNIMSELPAIGKQQRNQQQGWMFRGIDMIMNYVSPLFVKHGVFMVPQVLDSIREERQTKNGGNMIYTKLRVKYGFYATSDGSCIEAVVDGEGMDSGDKSTNKAMAVAMKYALFQVLCIPTEEMALPERLVDPDETTPEETVPVKAQPQKPAQTPAPKPVPKAEPEPIIDETGEEILCQVCHRAIVPHKDSRGKSWTITELIDTSKRYAKGLVLCPDCLKLYMEQKGKEARTA